MTNNLLELMTSIHGTNLFITQMAGYAIGIYLCLRSLNFNGGIVSKAVGYFFLTSMFLIFVLVVLLTYAIKP